jgi:ribosomal protein S27AE
MHKCDKCGGIRLQDWYSDLVCYRCGSTKYTQGVAKV